MKQLRKLFNIIPIKKTSTFKLKDAPIFLERMSELLSEGYTFSESLHLILPFHTNQFEHVYAEIDFILKQGLGVSEIFKKLGFSSQVLLSIYVAEKNGDLALCLKNNARFIRQFATATKKLQSILIYPCVLFIFLSMIMVGFRHFFLPNLQAFHATRNQDTSFASAFLPKLAVHLPDVLIFLAIIIFILIVVLYLIYQRLHPKKKLQMIRRVPVVNRLFVFWKTQQMTMQLGNLLLNGFAIQEALHVLKTQTEDLIIQTFADELHQSLVNGESFHMAVVLHDDFPKEFAIYIQHGEANGHLGKELLIYSDNLFGNLEKKLKFFLSIIQPSMFVVIAICIIAAYLALLLPIYQLIDTI